MSGRLSRFVDPDPAGRWAAFHFLTEEYPDDEEDDDEDEEEDDEGAEDEGKSDGYSE